VTRGAGAFICGESTALMASIEGKIGEPRGKHIHTVEKGLWNRPSNLNNVETWATVPLIINRGGAWHDGIGTERSKGTKIFSLVGRSTIPAWWKSPWARPEKNHLRYRRRHPRGPGLQGGSDRRTFGGVHSQGTGRFSGRFEKLKELGSMMGSGGMIIMDETTCMVDVAVIS